MIFVLKIAFLISAVIVAGWANWRMASDKDILSNWKLYAAMAYVAVGGGLAINMIITKAGE